MLFIIFLILLSLSLFLSLSLSSSRNLLKVTLPLPSGLLLSDKTFDCSGNQIYCCLLEHNHVKLRESHKRVAVIPLSLTQIECENLICKAEKYALATDGWTKNRHTAYPTTDIPLDCILGRFSNVHGILNGQLLPKMATFYGINEDYLKIGELFVVKYEYGLTTQKGLGPHKDGTPYSFVIALNDPCTQFTGGGTRFVDESIGLYRPNDVGTAVCFSGKNLHEGVEITSGIRYILTGFCNYFVPDISHKAFASDYDSNCDGSAGDVGRIEIGDIVRGVYYGRTDKLLSFTGLETCDEVKDIIRNTSCDSITDGEFSLLIERCNHDATTTATATGTTTTTVTSSIDDDDNLLSIKKDASRLVSIGGYISYDTYLQHAL